MKTLLLPLLLALLHVGTIQMAECPGPQNDELRCLTDYNRTITCVWISTYVSDHTDAECSINAVRLNVKQSKYFRKYSASCKLESVDVARPALKKCQLIFDAASIVRFRHTHNVSINLRCNPKNQSLIHIFFKPACHIKMNSPRTPHINLATVSWSPVDKKNGAFEKCMSQLQWKQKDEPWKNAYIRNQSSRCNLQEIQLNPDLLVQGESYEARVRVQLEEDWSQSTWSDWSPIASWMSAIGTTPPPPSVGPGGLKADVLGGTVVGAAVLALFLGIVLFKTDKTTWIYIVKKIRGPPLPDPRKSFLHEVNFKMWQSPQFIGDLYSFWKPEDVVPSEVTIVDAAAHRRSEAALLDKMRSESSCESSSCSFCNPNYSHLCVPPVLSLTAGNLEACPADTPYGPAGSQGDGKNEEEDVEEVKRIDSEVLQLLCRGSGDSEPLEVCSDYKRVEKIQAERCGLQSPDSGMCSGEEVSQESLEEEDGVGATTGQEEEEEDAKRYRIEVEFQKLLRGIFTNASIQVCSGYEQVEKPQAECTSLRSPDSGVDSGVEEQVSQDSLEDVDRAVAATTFLFPLPSSTLPHPLASFPALPLKSPSEGFTAALKPMPKHMLEMIGVTSAIRPVEPSDDGYMPVRVEEKGKERNL